MEVFSRSHVGKKRRNNEDSVSSLKLFDAVYVFMVADGVGGEKKGEVASERAIYHVEEYFKGHKDDLISSLEKEESIIDLIRSAISYSNNIVMELSSTEEFYMMATTIVMAFVYHDDLLIANVGDSRCYLYRSNKLRQITKDHTFVQELVDNKIITPAEAKTHREKNHITRAIGLDKELEIDIYKLTLQEKDIIMLCSDGLNSMLEDEEIEEIIQDDKAVQCIVDDLIQKALDKGGSDNVTVLCAKKCEVMG